VSQIHNHTVNKGIVGLSTVTDSRKYYCDLAEYEIMSVPKFLVSCFFFVSCLFSEASIGWTDTTVRQKWRCLAKQCSHE